MGSSGSSDLFGGTWESQRLGPPERPPGHNPGMNRLSLLAGILLLQSTTHGLPHQFQKHTPALQRRDLAAPFLELEQILRNTDADAATLEAANRHFDRATVDFFQGGFSEVARGIHETRDMVAGPLDSDSTALRRIRLRVEPPVVIDGPEDSARTLELRIDTLYGKPFSKTSELELPQYAEISLVSPGGRRGVGRRVHLAWDEEGHLDQTYPLEFGGPRELGPWRIEVRLAKGSDDRTALAFSPLQVTRESPRDQRKRLLSEVRRLSLANTELAPAQIEFEARAKLLDDRPSAQVSIEFLLDQAGHGAQLELELEALASGRDPYVGRVGDHWRVIAKRGLKIPYRFYAPTPREGEGPDTALPLVIAFHGAGGDENLYFETYGAGRLLELAEEHHFLCATPRVPIVGFGPEAFDALLSSIERGHRVDRERVYLIGHSMGGGVVSKLLAERTDSIHAAACLCGVGPLPARPDLPPTLVIAAALDPIVPAKGVLRSARPAIEAGASVTTRTVPGVGHTLFIGEVLPEVVDFLLSGGAAAGAGATEDGIGR